MPSLRTFALGLLLVGCAAPPSRPHSLLTAPVASGPSPAQDGFLSLEDGSAGATAVQGLLGVTFYDDMTFSRSDPMDPTNVAESDVSDMPTLGIGGHYRLFGNPKGFEGGLDGTLLFSWGGGSASVAAVGGGGAVIFVSTNLLIADIGFGLYASQTLGDKVRVYAAGGPLVQWGDGDFENDESETLSSGFGVGWYARGGVEFRVKPGEFFGIGVRNTWSEIDFGGSIGDVSTDGLQVFLAYTVGF